MADETVEQSETPAEGSAVEGAALSVGVGGVLVGIEDLHFVLSHQEDAAVAAALSLALDVLGSGKLDV